MLTAPAAEVVRKPRRVGGDDVADMVALPGRGICCASEDARRSTLDQSPMRLPGLNVGMTDRGWIDGSAEGERKGLHARIEKLDLE